MGLFVEKLQAYINANIGDTEHGQLMGCLWGMIEKIKRPSPKGDGLFAEKQRVCPPGKGSFLSREDKEESRFFC